MARHWLLLLCWVLVCGCSDDKRSRGQSAGTGGGTAGSGGTGTSGSPGSGGNGSGSGGESSSGGSTSGNGGSANSASSGTGGASTESTGGAGGAAGGPGAGAGGEAGGPPDPTAPLVIASGQSAPTGIAANDDFVVFANRDAGTIARCPLTGCGAEAPDIVVSDQDAPIAVALDGNELYWVTGWREGDSGAPVSRPVFRCPMDDCRNDTISEFDTGTAEPYGLRVTSDTIYLAAWPTLLACPKTGCSEENTVVANGPAVAVDFDATTLVVSMGGWSQVLTCSLTSCAESTPIASEVLPLGLVLDETHVYFAQHRFFNLSTVITPGIVRCPRSGCEAEPNVVQEAAAPYGLAQHGNRLYYTDLEAGTVVSIVKPDSELVWP